MRLSSGRHKKRAHVKPDAHGNSIPRIPENDPYINVGWGATVARLGAEGLDTFPLRVIAQRYFNSQQARGTLPDSANSPNTRRNS
jgi:hypothetical protein